MNNKDIDEVLDAWLASSNIHLRDGGAATEEVGQMLTSNPPINIQEMVKAAGGDPVYEETDSTLDKVAKQMEHTRDTLAHILKMGMK